MKIFNRTKIRLVLFGLLAIVGLTIGATLVIGITSVQARRQYSAVEVTFISPQQAVLFWKTTDPGVGYARWGNSRRVRDHHLTQTSSDPSAVHAVMLVDIPPEGIFVSVHTQGESRFFVPKVYHVQYQAGSEGGPL